MGRLVRSIRFGAELSHASDELRDPRAQPSIDLRLERYTQVQWTSASWHPAHFTVQYLSEPT